MILYNKKDDYVVLPAPGEQHRSLLFYVAAASLDKVAEYKAGDAKTRRQLRNRAVKEGALERLEEAPEGKDIVQVTYNPYYRFVDFSERLSKVDYDRRPGVGERLGRFKSKTFKQTLTLAGKEAAKSKGKTSRKEWTKTEGEGFVPFAHPQVSLAQGVEPTHLLKAESLQDDLEWYLGLKGITPVTLEDLPTYPANPMGALDTNDIKKINTIYAEDFEKYGYDKL